MRTIFFLLTLFISTSLAAQGSVNITPAQPERNKEIIIRYFPKKSGAAIPDTVTSIDAVFSYSNFYELPNALPLTRKGDFWELKFVLPRYFYFASFYLKSGNFTDQPDSLHHYSFGAYENGKRAPKSLLNEGYSLTYQMGKRPEVAALQADFYKKEIALHPGNSYEARLRLLMYEMAIAKTAPEKQLLREKAREVIASKFYERPGYPGDMNQTTMGYLIIGENTRVDSIRNVIRNNYPNTEAGYDLRIMEIEKNGDSSVVARNLENLLKEENNNNKEYLKDAHASLFKYYAGLKNTSKTLYHLKAKGEDKSPYKTESLRKDAEILIQNNITPDTAYKLLEQSLAIASTAPAGLIRYFPETGYIPSYVTDDVKKAAGTKAGANALSLMAVIKMKQNLPDQAKALMLRAVTLSEDAATMRNAVKLYTAYSMKEMAYNAHKKILLHEPENETTLLPQLKESYLQWQPTNIAGWQKEETAIQAQFRREMEEELQKEMILLAAPDYISQMTDLQNNPVNPTTIQNKVVVLNFWATWCAPCMKEMPYMQKAWEQYKTRNDVAFMIANSGSRNTIDDARGWSGNKTYSFPVYYNNDPAIAQKLNFNLIPATYIFDKKGNIRFKILGFEGPVIQRKVTVAIDMLSQM